ncbi:YT521-B-like domain-containing protein, partial [Melampsora americana]
KPALPRPPSHSEHALWVGNVPNDASHEELWKFFSGPQSSSLHPNQSASGVESIHLISRSNCAFVNYISQAHLQHAISICNGKTLRPFDPRSKPLVCRVRNPEDNVKSGVGAQRIGGMHRTWIRQTHSSPIHQDQKNHQSSPRSAINDEQCKRTSSTSTFNSNKTNSTGTASTTSSFLSKHFPRRYFILKSYTEEDLKLSVERSIWASQSHNEPILDQAYRTSSEGVYLIFSANRSGEFYGYAKMTGPIWRSIHKPISVPSSPISRPSLLTTRRASANDLVLPLPSLLIEKEEEVGTHEELKGQLLPAFEERRTTASPAPISPCVSFMGLAPPNSFSGGPSRSLPEPIRLEEGNEKKGEKKGEKEEVDEMEDEVDGLDDEVLGSEDSVSGDGKPFEIEWIRVQKLPFHLTRDLKNPFNGHREVKVSRDGTEIEPKIGAILISRIDEAATIIP